jgi:3-phosphoshikimate 1-carboxyvinyltransferase
MLNRLLILRSFNANMKIAGDSDADDVMKMKSALAHFERGEMADCGSAGTTLRFLALRVSRQPGTHHLSGALRLFERPQSELVRMLEQLGCEAELRLQRLTIRGEGWKVPPAGVVIDRSVSSQFASAVLLSAWDLKDPLTLRFSGDEVSKSYFAMTLDMVKKAGMHFLEETSDKVTVAPGCKVEPVTLTAEPDLSSAFAVAAIAALRGSAEFQDWPRSSLQPDALFPSLLAQMGCRVSVGPQTLRVEAPDAGLKPIEWNMRDCPDLFPVLAALCAFAEGKSILFGAPHLAHKESSRIEKIAEILRIAGRRCKVISGGLEIEGSARLTTPARMDLTPYSTDHDHRLAMAAAVAQAGGVPLQIRGPEVVSKSFPEYWTCLAQGFGEVSAP